MKGVLILLVVLFLAAVHGRVITFSKMQLPANNYDFHGYALLSRPTQSQISINVSFTNIDNDHRLDRIHIFVGPYKMKYLIDFSLDLMYNRRTCEDLHKSMYLEEIEALLSADDVLYRSFNFGKNESLISFSETVSVPTSGVWYAYIFNCKIVQILQQDKREGVYVTGAVEFINSYGYLEADRLLLLPVDTLFVLLFSAVLLVWLYRANRHRDLLRAQKQLVALMLVPLVELLLHLLTLVAYNRTGTLNVWAVTLTVVAGTTKRTLVRVVMLLVAFGYDTVRALTRRDVVLTTVFALLYAALSGAAQLTLELNGVTSVFDVLFLAPAAIVDLTVLLIALIALPKTVSIVKNNQQWAKMDVYRELIVAGIVLYVLGTMHLLFNAYATVLNLFDDWWYTWWMWDMMHHALYLAVVVAVAWQFKPGPDNARLQFNAADQPEQQVLEPLRVHEDEDDEYDFD